MTTLQQLTNPAQSGAPIRVNENFATFGDMPMYGNDPVTTAGLVYGFKGGDWKGSTIADGTVTRTGSTTNYIVAHRTTGVVSVSTSNTNWNNVATYGRVRLSVTSGSGETSGVDYRLKSGGIFDFGAAATGLADGDYGDFTVSSGVATIDASARTSIGATVIDGATSKTTPVDADEIGLADSAASFILKKLTWSNLKATLKTYFDTLYTVSTTLTTKGDLLTRDASAEARLPVGTDGYVLTADSAQTLGIKWAAASGSITATGSPANGNLTKWSGASTITNGDLSGDVTTSGTLATTIANDAVTYAKMQNISATSRILGRKTASAGDTEECTLSEVLDFIGSAAQGDILYRGSSAWARLAAGTSGYVLQTQGAGANPQWAAAGASSQGTHDVTFPAGSMLGRFTNGATYGVLDLGAGKPEVPYYAFDATTQQFATICWDPPKSWDEGTVTAIFKWCHPATATNFGVVWGIRGVAFGDTGDLSTAFGTGQTVSDTGGNTDTLYVTSATSAITIGGSPSNRFNVQLEVYRVPSDGSDTLAVDARLISVTLLITTNAETDA